MNDKKFEVIIIGGGPAGMSAVLVLGRSRIKTLVLNTETARNLATQHSHGFLTQDGKHPSEIFNTAKAQLDQYAAVTYRKEEVIQLEKEETGFVVETKSEKYSSTRVIVAAGYKDDVENTGINGLKGVYGQSVFPCPFCDGYEVADQKLAVFAGAAMVPFLSKLVYHWSKDVIAFTNGEKVEDLNIVATLNKKGIQVIEQKINQLISTNGQLSAVELEDGSLIEREAGFIRETKVYPSTPFAERLNVPYEDGHFGMKVYQVDENMETEVKGLYMIGDARTGWSGVASSVAEGSDAAQAITVQIAFEAWESK